MYPVWVAFWGALGIITLWLLVLSYLIFRQRGFLKRLFPKESGGDIKQKLEEVLESLEEVGKREKFLAKSLKDQALEGLSHVQTVKLLRYNPYHDTGGDQSFTLVLMDGLKNGVMLTSLHSRAGTRIYTKTITAGKSDLDLSKEERQVLEKS